MIKQGELKVQVYLTNPPTASGVVVTVDGQVVAVLTCEQVKRAALCIDEMHVAEEFAYVE